MIAETFAQAKRDNVCLQQTMIGQTASFVKADLEAITAKSPFLQEPRVKDREIAFFDRSEIRTGRVLGRGAFSVVYEIVGFDLNDELSLTLLPAAREIRQRFAATAINSKTGQSQYAIKHLQKELLTRQAEFSVAASDLALEAAYLLRMTHENILPLRGLPVAGLDALTDGVHDGYFLIFDRLQETLDHRIERWAIKSCHGLQQEEGNLEQTKVDYAIQLSSALEYLHRNRIIYRDLKPQNIGFNAANRLQLFDFGLCRDLPALNDLIEDEMYEMSGVGTRRYIAPEVVRESRYNCKADVYSWSLIVWQMFTHLKPYEQYSLADHSILICHGGRRPPLPSSCRGGVGGELSDDWPSDLKALERIPFYLRDLLRKAWEQSVVDRCPMSHVAEQLRTHRRALGSNDCAAGEVNSPLVSSAAWVTLDGIEVVLRREINLSTELPTSVLKDANTSAANREIRDSESSVCLGPLEGRNCKNLFRRMNDSLSSQSSLLTCLTRSESWSNSSVYDNPMEPALNGFSK